MQICFVVLTSYQLFVAEDYILRLSERDKSLSFYIISVGLNVKLKNTDLYSVYEIDNLNTNTKDRFKQRLFYGGYLFYFSKLSKFFRKVKPSILFVFNDNEPITNRLIKTTKNSIVLLIEEGIGVYAEYKKPKLNLTDSLKIIVTALIGSKIQNKEIGDNKKINGVVVSNTELYSKLKKSKNKIIIKQNKRLLFRNPDQLSFDLPSNYNDEKFDIVYLGQPFDINGDLSIDEKETLSLVFNSVNNNYKILIKPHPRDSRGKYKCFEKNNVKVIDEKIAWLPIELLMNLLNTKYVVAVNSSAAINLAFLNPSLISIFLLDVLEIKGFVEKNILSSQYSYSKDIFASDNNNILFPKNIDEFKAALLSKNEISQGATQSYDEIDSIISLINNKDEK